MVRSLIRMTSKPYLAEVGGRLKTIDFVLTQHLILGTLVLGTHGSVSYFSLPSQPLTQGAI
jgi:hypothetical protein